MTHNGRNHMTYFKFVRRMRGFYFVVLPTLLLAAVVCSAYWGTNSH